MICPNCKSENPPNSKFCNNCGFKLENNLKNDLKDPKSHPLSQYIPKELIPRLTQSEQLRGIEKERRIVTILFCDVQGSTAAASKMDPEEWLDIINETFKYLITPIYRYEGIVARLMGDAILAFFGAPTAHDDDPERAIRAGLDILKDISDFKDSINKKYQIDFDIRIGINTGLVIVGDVGTDLRAEYTAMGDAINLASRMEQRAEPGTILITSNTYNLVKGKFKVINLGEMNVKGKSEPINVFRPLSLLHIESKDYSSPFIGRNSEIKLIKDNFRKTLKSQRKIISIVGEAGLGKSRLLSEFKTQLKKLKSPHFILEGKSYSYTSKIPYTPFSDIFHNLFDFETTDSSEVKFHKIKTWISNFNLINQNESELILYLSKLLNLTISKQESEKINFLSAFQLHNKIKFAVRDLLFEIAEKRNNLILIFEDLHWVDPTSYEILQDIITQKKDVPLLIITLLRPEIDFFTEFKNFLTTIDSNDVITINLNILNEKSSVQLVESILDVRDNSLSADISDLILSKAEGNPFYIEEFVKSLMDNSILVKNNGEWHLSGKINNIKIPTTLAGVLSARLDSLDNEDKHVVQSASVIGREFPFSTLKGIFEHPKILDISLTGLEEKNLILKNQEIITEEQYLFKHLLTQEAAYNSLLNKRKKEIHTKIAEFYQMNSPEQSEYIESKIAHHFLKANEDSRALPYLVEAGKKSSQTFAIEEAENSFNLALDIAQDTKNFQSIIKAYVGLGNLYTITDQTDKAINIYQKMYDEAVSRNDLNLQVSALNKLSYVSLLIEGNIEEADKYRKLALDLKSDKIIIDELAETELLHCYINMQKFGDPSDLEKRYSWASEIGKDIGKIQAVLLSNTHRATSLLMGGKLDEAFELANETIKISEKNNEKQYLSNIYSIVLPFYYFYRGNLELAHKSIKKGIDLSENIFNFFSKIFALYCKTLILIKTGYFEKALITIDHSIEVNERFLQNNGLLGLNYALKALVLHIIGGENHQQMVQDLIEKALTTKDKIAGDLFLSYVYYCLVTIYYDYRDFQKISLYLDLNSRTISFDLALSRSNFNLIRAKVAVHSKDFGEASKYVIEARDNAETLQLKVLYPEIFLLQGKLELLKNNIGEGLSLLNSSLEIAEELNLDHVLNDVYFELSTIHRGDVSIRTKLIDTQNKLISRFEDEKLKNLFVKNIKNTNFYL